jgi:large subunit ribosomal protein L4
VKSLARKSAFAVKAQANNISVIDNIALEAPRTKDYIQFLNDLNVTGRKTLLILPDVNTNVVLSSRNVQKAKVTTASQVNTYDLMNADQLLISEEALSTIQSLFDK